jgi:hypothetical protein
MGKNATLLWADAGAWPCLPEVYGCIVMASLPALSCGIRSGWDCFGQDCGKFPFPLKLSWVCCRELVAISFVAISLVPIGFVAVSLVTIRVILGLAPVHTWGDRAT